jgi:hypothetical protein
MLSILSLDDTSLDRADKAAIAVHELMENACKYSTVGGSEISLNKGYERNEMVFSVSNITESKKAEFFKKMLDELQSKPPKQAYKEKLLANLDNPKISQLGLARIYYECDAKISYETVPVKDILEKEIPEGIDKNDLVKLIISITMPLVVKEAKK